MSKQILCTECGKPIKSVDELALDFKLFSLKPVHSFCFKPVWYRLAHFPFSYSYHLKEPLNTSNRWYIFVIFGILGLFPIVLSTMAMIREPPTTPWAIVVFAPFILIGLFFLSYPFARIVGYYKYEKPLMELK